MLWCRKYLDFFFSCVVEVTAGAGCWYVRVTVLSTLLASCRRPSDRWFSTGREGGLGGLSMERLRGVKVAWELWGAGLS